MFIAYYDHVSAFMQYFEEQHKYLKTNLSLNISKYLFRYLFNV